MTLRDGMGRDMGRGFRMGNTMYGTNHYNIVK